MGSECDPFSVVSSIHRDIYNCQVLVRKELCSGAHRQEEGDLLLAKQTTFWNPSSSTASNLGTHHNFSWK